MNRETNNYRNNNNRRVFNFGPREGNHIENAKVYLDAHAAVKRQIRVAQSVSALKAIVHILNSGVDGNDNGYQYLMTDVITLRDWVLNAEKNVPSSSKKIDINFTGEHHCTVMMNDNVVKFLNMGFDVKAENGPVFKSQMTTKMVETAVSLLSAKNGIYEPVINTKKFYPPLAMTETPALKLATAIDESGLSLRTEIISDLTDQVHEEEEAAVLIASMAPPMFAPAVQMDSRENYQLFPSHKAVPVLDEAYVDAFLKSINTLTKKAVYSEIANGHMLGHHFGVDDKYIKFLADFKSFDIEGDVVIHTADQQYAIALANYFESTYGADDRPEITIIGANVKKESRYNTTFAQRINRVSGTHIIPTCSSPQSEERISIFESSIDHDTQVKNDLCDIVGSIYRKIKVFSLTEEGHYLPSATMGAMECWEFLRTGQDAIFVDEDGDEEASVAVQGSEGEPLATLQVDDDSGDSGDERDEHDDAVSEDDDNDNDEDHVDGICWTKEDIRQEIAYYVMHWYIYPWIRIPLRTLKTDCVNLEGEYDLRMKQVDVIGYCRNSETDETVKAFLSNIGEYDVEIADIAMKHRGRFPSASSRRQKSASSFENDYSSSSVSESKGDKEAPAQQQGPPKLKFEVADSDEEDEEDDDPTGQSIWKRPSRSVNSRSRPAARKVVAKRIVRKT